MCTRNVRHCAAHTSRYGGCVCIRRWYSSTVQNVYNHHKANLKREREREILLTKEHGWKNEAFYILKSV